MIFDARILLSKLSLYFVEFENTIALLLLLRQPNQYQNMEDITQLQKIHKFQPKLLFLELKPKNKKHREIIYNEY